MSLSNCTIEPNPDISGIGVRTAIYAQAVLTLVQPLIASWDGRISESELVGLHRLYLGILLPGCALLLSAIIQAKTFGLSVYHGMIVLNLSWINNTSALIFFEFALIAQIKLDRERDFRLRVAKMLKLVYESLDGGDTSIRPEVLTVAGSRIQRLRSALEVGVTNGREDFKLEGSKEILENITQELDLLRVHVNSLKGAVAEGDVMNASEGLKKLIKKDRERLLLSLGMRRVLRKWPVRKGPAARVLGGLKTAMKFVVGGDKVVSLLQRDWTMASLASAHLILFAAFGVWLWFTIQHFEDRLELHCKAFESTTLVIFRSIPVTSSALRIASITIYTICLLPFINIVLIGALELFVICFVQPLKLIFKPLITCLQPCLACLQPLMPRLQSLMTFLRWPLIKLLDHISPDVPRRLPQNNRSQGASSSVAQPIATSSSVPRRPRHPSVAQTVSSFIQSLLASRYILYDFIVLTFGMQVYLILSTELTIKNNRHLIEKKDEASWTFGQTLAIALTILPLRDVGKEIWHNLVDWWARNSAKPGREYDLE